MTFTLSFVERRGPETSSIERLIRSVGTELTARGIDVRYDKVRYGNSVKGMLANLFAPRPNAADIYHVTGHIHYYALLLPKEKTVLTMHDVRILGMRTGIRRYLIKKIFYDIPIKKLKYIVTVSESSKADLVRLTNCAENKIRVIGNPVTVEILAHERKFEREKPRILQVGTAPNKNLPNLIAALRGISSTLIIIGPIDETIRSALLKNGIDFENRQGLSDEGIQKEYLNCDLVAFCSLSEGFGLPIIEAQAMMVPVVTSDRAPMKDVAGDGAVFVDPDDPASIKAGLMEVIQDEDLRRTLVENGRRNIRRFSADAIASQYEDIYRLILKNQSAN